MNFVLFLQAAQDRDRVFDRRFGYQHGLETPRERRILFDMFAKFVERRRADTMQLTPR